TGTLGEDEQAKYYSEWIYAAIHMAMSVPQYKTRAALAEHFHISLDQTSEILNFLEQTGLAKIQNGKYDIGPTHLHLPDNSPNILKHHTNWRLQALKSLDHKKPNNLHYSVVYSLSQSDAQKIRQKFLDTIKE